MEKGLHRLRFTSGYATALRRGSSRSALFSPPGILSAMPRPCALESHAHRYSLAWNSFCDATALRPGVSRSALLTRLEFFLRCQWLGPWFFTLTGSDFACNVLGYAEVLALRAVRSP